MSDFDNEMQKSRQRESQDRRDQDLYGGLIRRHILHHASKGPVFGLWFIEELARQGWRIKNLRSGHVMAFAPDQQTIVTLPGTPGDRNWKRIVLPKLRRGGFRDVR